MAIAIPTTSSSAPPAAPVTVANTNSSWVKKLLPVVLILLAGMCFRLGVWLWHQGQPIHIHDEGDYNTLALSLVQRGEFAFFPGIPATLRPPLYPALVAAVYALTGPENFQAVRLVQVVLSLGTAVLLYFLGCRVYSHRTGLWLCGFYCFYPSLVEYNQLLLTEVLFTFLLCAAIYTLVVAFQQESIRYLWLVGVLLGLGALTRSVLWLFPPFAALLILVGLKTNLKVRLLGVASLCLAFAVIIAPWAIRNTLLEKTFIPIDTMGGRNFMMGNYRFTPLYRSWDAISLSGPQYWYGELLTTHPEAAAATQGQRDKLALQHGLQFVRENPGLTLKRDLVKFLDFWGLERELVAGAMRGYFGPLPKPILILLALLIVGSYAGAMILGIFGIVLVPPMDRRLHALLLLVIGFVCLLHVVVFAHSRYHLPIMPLVLLYAAQGWLHVRDIWRQRRHWSFWLAGVLTVALVLGWIYQSVVVDLDQVVNLVESTT